MKHVVPTDEIMSVGVKRGVFSIRASDGVWYRVALPGLGRIPAYKAFGALLAGACVDSCAEPVEVEIGAGIVNELKSRGLGNEHGYPLAEGLYLGSQYVADPTSCAMYDLLPSKFMGQVTNKSIFSSVRGIDVWIGNADPSHAVYVRQPAKRFKAHMVGFGQSFNFGARPRRPFMQELSLFADTDSWEQTMIGVDRVNHLGDSTLRELARSIPSCWWACADRPATQIIDQLLHRRDMLPSMLSAVRNDSANGVIRKSAGRAEFPDASRKWIAS